MSFIARPASRSLLAPTSCRHLSSTAAVAAVKGKGAAKAPVRKKSAFGSKRPQGAPKRPGGGGGGGGGGSGATLRYSGAAELPDLTDLEPLYPDVYQESYIGRATTFPRKTFDQVKVFGLPRRLDAELERGGGPASVIRQSTARMAKTLEEAKSGSSKNARYVLSGDAGSGKSMLLLQTVSYAIESDWVVLFVPRASEWVTSSSQYAYHAPSQSFHQTQISASLLQKLLQVNGDKLSQLALAEDLKLDRGVVKKNTTLDEVCRMGTRDEVNAALILEGVLDSLAKQDKYPTLLAIDDAQALFSRSTFRAPDYTPLESYHLSAPRQALDYLSGRKSFNRGSIILSLSHSTPALPIPITLSHALQLPSSSPITPYTIHDPVHLEHASSGLKKIDVPWGMSQKEAGGIWQILSRKGWTAGTDETFLGAYTAAAGNPREFVRGLRGNLQALQV